jgi:hypothetical protein
MSTIQTLQGVLLPSLRQPEVLPALLRNAPLADDELHIALQLQFDEQLPMVVSFYEYYRFLQQLVQLLLDAQMAPCILVRVKMPATIALPPVLLDAKVALFHDLDIESAALEALGVEHICVDADFKLYSWSAGTNQLAIRYVSPAQQSLSSAQWQQIQAVLATLPLQLAPLQTEVRHVAAA